MASITSVEIDFGSTPQWVKSFVIVDATVTTLKKVVSWQSSDAATGRVGNDTEWDQLLLAASPGTGDFTLTAMAFPGPVVGKRKILYQVSP